MTITCLSYECLLRYDLGNQLKTFCLKERTAKNKGKAESYSSHSNCWSVVFVRSDDLHWSTAPLSTPSFGSSPVFTSWFSLCRVRILSAQLS